MKKIHFIALLGIVLICFTSCKSKNDPGEDVKTYYTVTFNADGGTPVPPAQRVEKGKTATVPSPAPTKQNFLFVAWSLDGTNAYDFQTPVTKDITLKAKWQEESPDEDLVIDKTTLTLRTTDRERLSVSGNKGAVSWSSSNKEVAKVDADGVITATGEGSAVITATSGNKSATCSVSVAYSVLAVGKDYDGRLVLLKNGKDFNLGSYAPDATIKSSVFVYDGDIYVTGNRGENYGGTRYKDLYVMKIKSPLPGGTFETDSKKMERKGIMAFSEGLFITNGDVYVAGYEVAKRPNYQSTYQRAVLWKNGKMQTLEDNPSAEPEARSVFVSGANVYVVGDYGGGVLWKNGTRMDLASPDGSKKTDAYSVFVSGNDIYIGGAAIYQDKPIDTGKPLIWKNNVPFVWGKQGGIYSIFVSGNDLYASGYGPKGTVWKNGTVISTLGSALVRSVYVYAGKVYAVSNDGIWIDGEKQPWPAAYLHSVFVK
ncbi:InlB B-repeat-containing protein [Porphyromonas canoris]|uniref:InlB B-repeat-containing protein n=1 Tax=Porphyromonas canoris TaxID=36875 RepID=UPI001F2AC9A0|nr:InlB B-repeat-containing protein [Porphyromonas canoris]